MPMLLYDVTLRGVSMTSLSDDIIVRDIVEMPPKEDRVTFERAMHAGTRVTSIVRRTLPIKIIFNVRAYDGAKRAEIMDKIAGWVGTGGKLTINTRPGKRLFVRPADMPRLDSSLKWTEDLSLTLTAYEQPYWEDSSETIASGGMKTSVWSESHQEFFVADVLSVPGNVEKVPVCVAFYNVGEEPLTHIKLVSNDTFFELENLSVEPGMYSGYVFIEYDEHDLLMIHDVMSDVSLMANRTAESSDDLFVRCGRDNQLYAYSDQPVKIQFSTRGRWL